MGSTGMVCKSMTMTEIKAKAKGLGIEPGKLKKADLIHVIQVAEGCTPCYGLSKGHCPWTQCCWRTDCFKVKA